MKHTVLILLICISTKLYSQKIDSVQIPKDVTYNYCSPELIEKSKGLLRKELSDSTTYILNSNSVFVGPTLWARFKNVPAIANISGGNVFMEFNKQKLAGKVTQNRESFKLVWDQLKSEIKGNDYTLRKATFKEIQYYWAIIAFDIDEPLLILETKDRRYLFNFTPKDLKLMWIDEMPVGTK